MLLVYLIRIIQVKIWGFKCLRHIIYILLSCKIESIIIRRVFIGMVSVLEIIWVGPGIFPLLIADMRDDSMDQCIPRWASGAQTIVYF